MSKSKIMMLLMLAFSFAVYSAVSAQPFAPKAGKLEVKEQGGVKVHVYNSGTVSVIIETPKSLVLQDTQEKKVNKIPVREFTVKMKLRSDVDAIEVAGEVRDKGAVARRSKGLARLSKYLPGPLRPRGQQP